MFQQLDEILTIKREIGVKFMRAKTDKLVES